jgi:hypothetical protein
VQQSVWAGRGWRTSLTHPPTAGWGGDDGDEDAQKQEMGGVRGDGHLEGKRGEDNNDDEFNYGKDVTA